MWVQFKNYTTKLCIFKNIDEYLQGCVWSRTWKNKLTAILKSDIPLSWFHFFFFSEALFFKMLRDKEISFRIICHSISTNILFLSQCFNHCILVFVAFGSLLGMLSRTLFYGQWRSFKGNRNNYTYNQKETEEISGTHSKKWGLEIMKAGEAVSNLLNKFVQMDGKQSKVTWSNKRKETTDYKLL